jgi:hypothetical protein
MKPMMKRKRKVFLSSSFVDLEAARLRLLLKTLKLGHIPAGMELFQPGEPRNLDVIEKEIATSDIFVILVGARLGSPISGDDPLTYTMKEYELAKKHGLPIIPFLLDNKEFKDERDKIPSDRQLEREQESYLQGFRQEVQNRADGGKRLAGFFSYNNIAKLSDEYADALRTEVDRLEDSGVGGGWVEGPLFDQLNARITLGEAVSTNPFFQRYANRLSTFVKLSERTQLEAPSKAAIAGYFWEQYMARLDEHNITNLYFESGSSIAYVSRKFIEYVKEEDWFYHHKMETRLKLRTNNLLTYLDFLLIEPQWRPIDIQLVPHGFISHDYGASYGDLKCARKIQAPSQADPNRTLPEDATKAVTKLAKALSSVFNQQDGLALMTTSGIDIDSASPFPGPHVGSYYNMLMKRCLFSLPCAKVLFLDERKWGFPFGLGYCHSVCDRSFPWDRLKSRTPLAVAIAAKSKDARDRLCESLAQNGFELQERGEPKSRLEGAWPIIAANSLFAERFKPKNTSGAQELPNKALNPTANKPAS